MSGLRLLMSFAFGVAMAFVVFFAGRWLIAVSSGSGKIFLFFLVDNNFRQRKQEPYDGQGSYYDQDLDTESFQMLIKIIMLQ